MADPQHVIVIAFENRSFDHMLGFAPPGGALTGQESNPVDPANPDSARVPVNKVAGPVSVADPNHTFEGVRETTTFSRWRSSSKTSRLLRCPRIRLSSRSISTRHSARHRTSTRRTVL